MLPVLAAYADAVVLDALLAFLPVAGIAGAFGFVYWLFRRRKWAREDADRKRWIAERRENREAQKREGAER